MENNIEFLVTVDQLQAEMIVPLLEENGIPVLKKYRDIGGYLEIYMGKTSLGIDLYVSTEKLNKAEELLELYNNIDVDNEENLNNGQSVADNRLNSDTIKNNFDKMSEKEVEILNNNKKESSRHKRTNWLISGAKIIIILYLLFMFGSFIYGLVTKF